MNMEERDRLKALEINVEHLKRTVDDTSRTVTELRDLLLQAKGARWMIGILIAIGGMLAGVASRYIPFLPLPR